MGRKTKRGQETLKIEALRQTVKVSAKQKLHNKFREAWEATGWPMPQEEGRFHPQRKWRWDFFWPDLFHPLAVEIQGGTYLRGRTGHSGGPGQTNDLDKLNAAQLLGWRVLYFDTTHIRDIDETVRIVMEMMAAIEGNRNATEH